MKYSREDIIQKLKQVKPALFAKYPLRELALFGSYARGDNKEGSDIDILVDFDGAIGLAFFTLVNELEDNFDAKVDVVPRKGIKARVLPFIEKNLVRI